MGLKTDYKDDILDTSVNTKRKYRMTNNPDGTVSFDDETVYTQEGDNFSASDANAITQNLTVADYTAVSATTLTGTIDEYIAQANMSDGETRRVNISYDTYNRVIEISRIGSNYCGICLDTTDVDFRYNFIKVGGASTEISPFKTTHTETYTYPSGSTGGTYDMGTDHKYRYVNAENVYNKGKADYTVTTVTTLKSDTSANYASNLAYTFTSSYKLAIAIAIGGDYNGNQVASVTVNPSSKVALSGSLSCNNYAAGYFAVIKNPSSGDTVYMRDWVQGRRVVIGIN